MSECLLRHHEVNPQIPLPPIGSVTEKLREQETKKEIRRQHQISTALSKKRKLEEEAASVAGSPGATGSGGPEGEGEGDGEGDELVKVLMDQMDEPRKLKDGAAQVQRKRRGDPVPFGMNLSKPVVDARGHTSYLTFATLLPVGLRAGDKVEGEEEEEDEKMETLDHGECFLWRPILAG